jgi:hypothetical protein
VEQMKLEWIMFALKKKLIIVYFIHYI